MTNAVVAAESLSIGPARRPAALPLSWFEWGVVALSTALAAGAHVDAWAHGHLSSTLETFFTPWHALLYSAFAATSAFLVLTAVRTDARPWHWAKALPDGYGLSLLGCLMFGVGGILDMAWHLVFGIERSFQALISPTHLVLMVSSGLIVSGPLRAAWLRPTARLPWTAVVSACLTLSLLTFFGQFDHPFTSQWAAAPQPNVLADRGEQLGILGVILQAGFLMGVVLALVRRFELPFGSLTLLIGANALFVTLIRGVDAVILVGVLGGLMADVLVALLRPSAARVVQLRAFAFLAPALLYGLYFLGLIMTDGVWWPVHVWAGAPVIAGLTGWLLSLVIVPPTPAAAR